MIKALRGMKDSLPPESEKYLYFLEHTIDIVRKYGYGYIETPLLEETALFKRSVGESSDIVGKEMYQFTDKGGNDVCLRPEGTAGVVRSFIEHKLDRIGGIHRFFYYGPMFRYERPQKGRFRQFRQFGVESFGEASFYEDANVIMMLKEILDFFKIPFTLKLNTLGCQDCLPPFREDLVRFLGDIEDGLCEDCIRRKGTNPIRVFDCKNEKCQELLIEAPRLGEALCTVCDTHFSHLTRILDRLGITYEIDPNLVRGLDYYNRTAFEFVSDALGAQNAVAGGGRYDRLVEFLGGRATPAIGFAIGVERIIEMIELPSKEREGYYFGALCEEALPLLFEIAQKQRKTDRVTMQYQAKSLKAHLKAADKASARYCMIIGEEELANNTIWVKDLLEKSEEIRSLG
ncbi:MAG: histidine--tRNA ligase [Campylobacteraceae bacterium 4484_4]|nr:MAG: histidine--tRNA ligase [Campylobacteraceae bacterium 4484_4]